MAALDIKYDGKDYTLDLEDMDTEQARAMERFGVPNLKALDDGIAEGDLKALTVAYWIMLVQNGEPGARLERVQIKPIKFVRALVSAALAAEKAAKDAEGNDDED
jgi:hypothetical protein